MESSELTYGSDPSGLVWGFVFRQGQPAAPIGASEAIRWIEREAGASSSGFVWLHFNLSHVASMKWMREHARLPEEFFEALQEGSRSTRIEQAENTLIAVVNDVLHNFSFDPTDIATLWVSVTEKVVISVRRTPLKSIERLHQAVEGGAEIHSSLELLIHLLRDQADVLIGIVRNAVAQVDDIEDKLLAGRVSRGRADLGALRRVLVRLQRLLAPEPASMFRLLQKPPHWIAEADRQDLRQSTEEFAVVLNDMVALQERIKLLQEEIAAQINDENNRSLFVLTAVTVLALPINIVSGLLGMNVGGVPLAKDDGGFWIIVALVAAVTLTAGWIVVRRQKDN
ncbi:MAG: transporter [Burkholderiales bacterium]|nr:transporter [Burkholderiales bacterium]